MGGSVNPEAFKIREFKRISRLILILSSCCGLLFFTLFSAFAQDMKKIPSWERHVELSFVNTSGNTDTVTLSARMNMTKEGEKNRYLIKGNILYGEDNDEGTKNITKNKWSFDARWERVFAKRIFGFLYANYMDDKLSGYDYRISGGPGIGYDLIKTEGHHLKGLLSPLYHYDKFYDPDNAEDSESSDDYFSLKTEVDYKWQILDNLKFLQNFDYLISSEDSKKYFVDSETALHIKVNRHISLGISNMIAYQNKPPTDIKEHTDITFSTSLIVDF